MKAEIKGVSILKPLKGVDPNLEDNLETLFELDYPQVISRKRFCLYLAEYRFLVTFVTGKPLNAYLALKKWCTIYKSKLTKIFFLQYEILFCIQEMNDPAHDVVRRLMSKYPNIESRIITGYEEN